MLTVNALTYEIKLNDWKHFLHSTSSHHINTNYLVIRPTWEKMNWTLGRYFRLTWILAIFFSFEWQLGICQMLYIEHIQTLWSKSLHILCFFFSNSHILLNKLLLKCCQYIWRCQCNLGRNLKDCTRLSEATVKNIIRRYPKILVMRVWQGNCKISTTSSARFKCLLTKLQLRSLNDKRLPKLQKVSQ